MSVRVAINGFGRIGRLFYRAALKDSEFMKNFEVVAVNDLATPNILAYLLKYDSIHGILENEISWKENVIIVDGKEIKVFRIPDPAKLPWKELEVDIVLESTGRFRDRQSASKHLEPGAKKVIK